MRYINQYKYFETNEELEKWQMSFDEKDMPCMFMPATPIPRNRGGVQDFGIFITYQIKVEG